MLMHVSFFSEEVYSSDTQIPFFKRGQSDYVPDTDCTKESWLSDELYGKLYNVHILKICDSHEKAVVL